jgi:UDP-GlcNAc:undecaprenyl-phosphate GlcNAc-1-phosphate transferase
MSGDLTPVAAFVLAAVVTAAMAPLCLRVARRTGFLDLPHGYKEHESPTPYLGGTAVLVGFLCAVVAVSDAVDPYGTLLACAVGLWALGTLDDRIAVRPTWRVLAEVGVAAILTANDLGWTMFESDVANFGLTALWIVGVVNAFNLMDNLDGATSTVAGVTTLGVGALALSDGHTELAALNFAVAGACLGFLPFNLARPARIFLGDGGSMTLGFLIASLTIAGVQQHPADGTLLLASGLLVGLPVFDTALVVFSRYRAGISLLTGGRDHVTHRLLRRVGDPRRVAAVLAGLQAALSGAGILALHAGKTATVLLALVGVALGVAAIKLLQSPAWRPARQYATPALKPVAVAERELDRVEA